jgi:hypothetical protein
MHLQCLPIKNIMGTRYGDDLLPNNAHIAVSGACLHRMALLCILLNYVVVSGQPFPPLSA